MFSTLNHETIADYFNKIKCPFLKVTRFSNEEKLNALNIIYRGHIQQFPFHNFELAASSKVHSLHRKPLTFFKMAQFIEGDNGGFCFQSSSILYSALKHADFEVFPAIAKVLNKFAPDSPEVKNIPATHLILIVTIDNTKYLVDPTLGMLGCFSPFLIPEQVGIYKQNNQDFKIEKLGDEYFLYRNKEGDWCYHFVSSFLAADEKTISLQLTKLNLHPDVLGIRDLILLVGIATPTGGKTLLWDAKTNLFTFKIICSEKGISEISIENRLEAYLLIRDQFKVTTISFEAFEKLLCPVKPTKLNNLFLDFPLGAYETKSLQKI